jgi:hypothetical protein
MSKASIQFALQTNRKRSEQEIAREMIFFDKMFAILNAIIPVNITETTDDTIPTVIDFDNPANERSLDTTRKIVYGDTDPFGYRFTAATPLSVPEIATILHEHSIRIASQEDCLNGIPPCTVYLSLVN